MTFSMAEKNKSTSKHQATAFERVQLARHPERPYTLDFIERLFEDFTEIHGDRRYADDPAIVCGFARFHGMPVLVVGHQKGRDTRQRQFRNALAIGVGDQLLMLENAIYSVISPEGCAAILWKDSSQAARAAEELRLTAEDLHREGIVDQVIDEPEGGAQTSHDEAARLLDAVLCARLAESVTSKVDERLARRYQKMRQVGKWGISESPSTT